MGLGWGGEARLRKPPSKSMVLVRASPVAVGAGPIVCDVPRHGRPKKPLDVSRSSSASVVHTLRHGRGSSGEG